MGATDTISASDTPHPQGAIAKHAVGLCGILGALLLADAPSYSNHLSGGRDFSLPLAAAGTILTLLWLLCRVRSKHRSQTVDLLSRRQRAWRSWQGLVVCSWVFLLLSLLDAPIHISAPVALATVGLCAWLLWNLARLSATLMSAERAGPIASLRWLILAPCSLAVFTCGLVLLGDSWVTLLVGSFAACLGPVFGGCRPRARARTTPRPARELPSAGV